MVAVLEEGLNEETIPFGEQAICLPPEWNGLLMERYSAYFNEPTVTGEGCRRQKLFHACRHFGIEPGTHRALSDAQAARHVLIRLAMLKES